MKLAVQASTETLRGSHCDRLTLARVARELELRFHAHLTFEETALAPVLAQADLWGPERVKELHEEHHRQRTELRTVVDGIESGWGPEALAVALRSLATDLLLDMEAEEQGCLMAPVFQEDAVTIADRR